MLYDKTATDDSWRYNMNLIKETEVWTRLQHDALAASEREPALRPFLRNMILDRNSIADAFAYFLGQRLGAVDSNQQAIREVCQEAFTVDNAVIGQIVGDMTASFERDPACRSLLQPFFHYKGVSSLQTYRVAHWLWGQERELLAFHFQSLCSQVFQVDIHPAARLGSGIFLDHATGVVIGETSVVGDDVSILHSVTLGGNGKERGDRHPKIGRGVLISVGAKILGNIKVGDEARIAACSVVLQDVPAHATVAGIPAKLVHGPSPTHPAKDMDHSFKE